VGETLIDLLRGAFEPLFRGKSYSDGGNLKTGVIMPAVGQATVHYYLKSGTSVVCGGLLARAGRKGRGRISITLGEGQVESFKAAS